MQMLLRAGFLDFVFCFFLISNCLIELNGFCHKDSILHKMPSGN